MFVALFSVLYKRTERFCILCKKSCVLWALFCSLEKNGMFFWVPLVAKNSKKERKRTLRSLKERKENAVPNPVIFSFSASFSLLFFILLVNYIPKTVWDAKILIVNENKREWGQNIENCIELPNKEIVILGLLYSPLLSVLIYENQKKVASEYSS